MARSLPFDIVAPERFESIGDGEVTGMLRFRRRGSISVPERAAVTERDQSGELFKELADLCLIIQETAIEAQAAGYATPMVEALAEGLHRFYFASLAALDAMQENTTVSDPLAAELAMRFCVPLRELNQRRQDNALALVIRKATTMIQRRLVGCEDWTDEDTIALDSERLILEISMFYDREAGGLAQAAQQSAEAQIREIQEALGKLRQETGSPPATPTGETSTGSSSGFSPEIKTSAPKRSRSSRSSTSSRRSSPAAA